jgi:transmembrane sensor
MKKQGAKSLISKYLQGETTPDESSLLEQGFLQDLQSSEHTPSQVRIEEADKRITANLMSHIGVHQTETKTIRLWPRIVAAATILLFLSFGAYFLLHKNTSNQQVAQNQIHDIAPGSNKAILTLANGKTIILNNAKNGLLSKQGSSIVKSANGEVIYQQVSNETQNTEVTYNSITIPRGAEYQVVVLPDGSNVWINAASSLRYPTAFSGNERKVELTGEAYFEVTHNPAKPFMVSTNSQTVEVLGTHFNINAYTDEPAVKTTLLEGKVKVTATADNAMRILLPGQQAALNSNSFTVNPAETEEAVAWKNGRFMFEGDNIQHIMRTISRWYNVDIAYSGQIPDDSFSGGTSRFKNVSEVLNIFQLTGKVRFKIEGRKITVSK